MNLVELTKRKVSMSIRNPNATEIKLTLFNPGSVVRSEVVEAELYLSQDDFSILGADGEEVAYTILEMVDQTQYVLNQGNILDPGRKMFIPEKVYKAKVAIATSALPSVGYTQLTVDLKGNSYAELVDREEFQLENEYYRIGINADGSLDVLDKMSGTLYVGKPSWRKTATMVTRSTTHLQEKLGYPLHGIPASSKSGFLRSDQSGDLL